VAAGLFGKKNKTCHAYFTAYCHKTMKRVCKKKWEKNEKAGLSRRSAYPSLKETLGDA
jgi:hypothetical protein